jgi:beta-glucuronidase
LWQFRLDPEGEGRSAGWFSGPLPDSRDMAVPASFDDFAADATVRDYFGDIWYQTSVWVPQGWQGRRIVLDFESATHRATVWVNDVEVMSHEGGYTPFEADVTDHVNCRAAQPGGMVAPADQTLLIFDLRLHVPVPR